MRKITIFLTALILSANPALARGGGHSGGHYSSHSSGAVHVRGYFRRNGTYVAPHYRSHPDHTRLNNWSTRGNVNPYTSQEGTRDPNAPN